MMVRLEVGELSPCPLIQVQVICLPLLMQKHGLQGDVRPDKSKQYTVMVGRWGCHHCLDESDVQL